MNKKSAFEVYLSVVYKWGIIMLVGACMCAALTYTLLKAIGQFQTTSWTALIIFDIMDIVFLALGILLVKTSVSEDGYLADGRLKIGKVFASVILIIQWNYILYMNSSRTFWGFLFFFMILLAFFLDIRLVMIDGVLLIASLVVAWVVRGNELLPVKDEIFFTDMVNCVVGLFLSFIGLIAFIFFMTHFLINAKKDELEENNQRIEQILNSVQNISKKLMLAGGALDEISANESSSAEELSATSESLLSGSNQLSRLSEESVANLHELTVKGEEVNRRVERVENTSDRLLDMSKKNEKLMNSLQQINADVVKSISETDKVAANLNSSVEEIGGTMQIINEIADSTNLLALNASIEAARAGEAGKGFAVVATEVGNLAGNTQQSLVKVQEIIDKVKQCVFEMTTSVSSNIQKLNVQSESFENVFKGLNEMISLLHESMAEIKGMGNSHDEQAEVIRQTIQISENIADSIRRENEEFANISGMVEENANDIASMTDQIAEINNMVGEINNLLNV
ncbi:MAG: methyl-accepting chemotaxis protein [Clostridiales bacterium]|nr:methyl-accepting chemotaxis protein [Clostridiales bacterium]